jgi:hypothetical protein
MPQREQDNTPYLTPGVLHDTPQTTTRDQQEYSTLKVVGNMLIEAQNALSKDFNAFDILEGADRPTAAENLLRQVEARQIAYRILYPTVEAVISAIQKIDINYKQ